MRGLARNAVCLAITLLAFTAWGQHRESVPETDGDETRLDLSFPHDPRELQEEAEKALRWKRILGPVGIGEFHVFPAREPGPYGSPPLRIWGTGFGTSLWRDPVTGWPLQ